MNELMKSFVHVDSASPRFVAAFSHNLALLAMTICFATIIRIVLGRLNKQLDNEEGLDIDISGVQPNENEEHGLPGRAVTRGFRFLL